MNIILFDTEAREKLFPITLTRAVADVRMGILSAKERWEKLSGADVYIYTERYLRALYETIPPGEFILIDAAIILTPSLVQRVLSLQSSEAIGGDNGLIAGRTVIESVDDVEDIVNLFKNISIIEPVKRLETPANIFQYNAELLNFDYELVTKRRYSANTNDSVHLIKASKVFIEEGADINYAILNATNGPIYIAKNTVIMEYTSIRGPFALCEGATLKMGSRIYGATTIGPDCTASGEIKNSVMMGYSNKGHDGYMGDSVIGEWCNWGAGTSNSNVKNTAGVVNLWSYSAQQFLPAGNKCGVIMGDYSRTAINTSINTGTVAGVCCNVFSEGLTPTVIPDFSWGTKPGKRYDLHKALKDIDNWKRMKNKTISETERNILRHIFEKYSG